MVGTTQAATEIEKSLHMLRRQNFRGLVAMFGAFAIGIACFQPNLDWPLAGILLFLLVLGLLLYVLMVRRRIRAAVTQQMEQAGLPPEKISGRALFKIAVSRAILVTPFIIVHDPVINWVLGILCAVGVVIGVATIRSKPAYGLTHLIKAAVYGIATVMAVTAMSNDQAQASMVVSKLEMYKLQHGGYPERLDALVPALLPEIPKVGLMKFLYTKEEKSYQLTYRPSVAGPCSYRPEAGSWKCHAR